MDDSLPQKRCTGPCNRLLPVTSEFFHHNTNHKDGFRKQCKECLNAMRRAGYEPPPKVSDIPDGYKRCTSTCKRVLPATKEFFYPHPTCVGGLNHQCKECKLSYERSYLRTPEGRKKDQAHRHKRYHENLEESRKKGRTYRAARYAREKAIRGPHPFRQSIEALINYQVILPKEPPQDRLHYTYALKYPEDYPDTWKAGTVFYIGKGMDERINEHERDARRGVDDYRCNVIRKIWRQGKQIVKEILAYFETHEEALQYEIALVFFMDGLVNLTSGGEGVLGLKHSEATKNKISAIQKGIRRGTPSIEHRRHLSEAMKGRPSPHRGRSRGPMSEGQKRKVSAGKKGSIPWNKGKSMGKRVKAPQSDLSGALRQGRLFP